MSTVAQAEVKVARAELVKRVLIVVTAFLVLACLGLLSVVLVQVRYNQRLTQSCVIPGRACYERGQQQTAQAVGDINHVVILAAACAGNLPSGIDADKREDLITACITKRLADATVK